MDEQKIKKKTECVSRLNYCFQRNTSKWDSGWGVIPLYASEDLCWTIKHYSVTQSKWTVSETTGCSTSFPVKPGFDCYAFPLMRFNKSDVLYSWVFCSPLLLSHRSGDKLVRFYLSVCVSVCVRVCVSASTWRKIINVINHMETRVFVWSLETYQKLVFIFKWLIQRG